ncbi:MAG: amidohydrolase family protein [Gammaproteobacteria bacterium]|nr:amidohydrolase family protein [Gammaproteobacteria bacterium]
MAHDIVIRGGDIVDGTGAEPVPGDVAIDGDLITAVGEVSGKGIREIDAEGHMVSPGFIDLHTHLDAQIGWDPALTPVSWHGVTTALMGNCGVTFAPCKPADRELLAGMMETVEDIPKHAILTGLPWTWEHYGGYLDALDELEPGINVAGMVGHCAVRYYVMGERAVEEQATYAERRQMAEIVGEAIDAGAVGFSTNRYAPHKLPDGRSIPGTFADPEELVEIAEAVAPRNALMQAVGADFEVLKAISDAGRGRILFSYGSGPEKGMGRAAADRLEEICDGRDITAITQVRGSGFMFGLQSTLPFPGETWESIRKLDLAGRLAAINEADTAAKLIEEGKSAKFRFDLNLVFSLGDGATPDYAAPAENNVYAMGKAAGEHFVETFLRISRESAGKGLFNLRMFNQSLTELGDLIQSKHIYPSLGDAGAHVSQIMDAGWCSFVLSYWMREQSLYTLGEGIRRLTSGPARVLNLSDRGTLAVGKRADVNVFDFDRVAECQPELVHDFPGGAPRYIQRSTGYKTTIVNGQVNVVNGEHTGVRAGRVLRHRG